MEGRRRSTWYDPYDPTEDRSNPNASMMTQEAKPVGTFERFTHETTLHGFRYLTRTGLIRKLVWILILIAATVVLVVQLYKKYQHYQKNPITTKIDMEYPSKMLFPAVAICNTNQFRISYTADILPLISAISNTENVTSTNQEDLFAKLQPNQTNSKIFLKAAAHHIKNMLISCKFPNGSDCSSEDFELITTDYGICYGINTGKTHQPISVSSAGVLSGLRMVLNVESYEHVERKFQTLGMKILIYNQTSLPMVSLKGLDVPLGFLSQIGIAEQIREKIDVKYGGTCVTNQPLDHFPASQYSVERCKIDKILNNIEDKCSCTPYNSPVIPEGKSRCTAQQHFTCVIQQTDIPDEAAKCKENCTSVRFKKMLSFSALSESAISLDLTDEVLSRMMKQFKTAKEVRVRHHPTEIAATKKEIDEFFFTMDKATKDLELSPFKSHYVSTFDRLKETQCFSDLVQKTKNLNLKQPMIDEAGGKQQWTETEIPLERLILTMFPDEATAQDLLENNTITTEFELIDLEEDLRKGKNVLSSLTAAYNEDSFYMEMQETVKDYEDFVRIIQRFQTGDITKFQLADTSVNKFLFLDNKLRENLFYPLYANIHGLNIFLNREATVDQLVWFWNKFAENSSMTQLLLEEILYEKEQTMEGSKKNKSCIDTMKQLRKELEKKSEKSPLDGKDQEHPSGDKDVSPKEDHPHPKPKRRKRKADPAQDPMPPNEEREIADEDLLKMCPTNSSLDMLQYINELISCTQDISMEIAEVEIEIRRVMEAGAHTLADILSHFQSYLKEFQLDEQFFERNTLAVNIYYQDLSIEHLIQVETYDIWSLACDTGGTLGLFLGASALTVFEIIDFFILKPIFGKKKRNELEEERSKELEKSRKRREREKKSAIFGY